MNLEHTIKEIEQSFDKNQIKWLSPDPLEPQYMIPDFGAIKDFLKQALIRVAKETAEAGKVEEVKDASVNDYQAGRETGWNDCTAQQRDQLQEYFKGSVWKHTATTCARIVGKCRMGGVCNLVSATNATIISAPATVPSPRKENYEYADAMAQRDI